MSLEDRYESIRVAAREASEANASAVKESLEVASLLMDFVKIQGQRIVELEADRERVIEACFHRGCTGVPLPPLKDYAAEIIAALNE